MSVVSTSAPAAISPVLFVLRNADMTLTTDQVFSKVGTFTTYAVESVYAVRKTGAFGVACVGGVYTGAAKTGSNVLAAAQVWSALTGAGTMQYATLANLLQAALTATPILNLTTGNTGALTADLFITGISLD